MSHKDNMDLRNTGDGGWFYAEHELFSVFAPLVGPLGVSVYMAMCRLVPLAAVDPYRQVTVRSVSAESCVSKSTVARLMEAIARLGMVEEKRGAKNRPSTYKLVSLRKVGLVGIEELRRRLGVPVWDTGEDAKDDGGELRSVHAAAQVAAGSSSAMNPPRRDGGSAATRTGRSGVPHKDTSRRAVQNTHGGLLVSQKRALVSQKQGVGVPNGRVPLIKKNEEEDKYSPLPLSQAKGDLPRAVAKVKRECGLTLRGIDRVLEEQMRLVASRTDQRADWNAIAERMIAMYAKYLEHDGMFEYKPEARKFFAGGLWDDMRKWPQLTKEAQQRGRRF